MGILRSFESVGSTFSYVAGAVNFSLLGQEILSFALWGAALLPTTYAVYRIPATRADGEAFETSPLSSGRNSRDEKSSSGFDSANGPNGSHEEKHHPTLRIASPGSILTHELQQDAP